MRRLIKGLAVASLIGSVSAHADGAYISLGGGLSSLRTIKSNEMPILYQNPTFVRMPQLGDDVDSLKFKNGMKLSGALGYKLLNYRAEVEYSYQKNKYQGFYLNNELVGFNDHLFGYAKVGSLFLNAYYDLRLSSFFTPYVGVGVGGIKVKNKLSQTDYICNNTGQFFPVKNFKSKNKTMGYQAIVGAMFDVTDEIGLGANYSFTKTFKKISAFDNKLGNHSINFKIIYNF